MFGWGRKATVEERAKLIARMINFILYGLQTKTYEQFVESFSNPDAEPNVLDRHSHKLHFQLRISPTCWYDATATLARPDVPSSACLRGGGDDLGVFITIDAGDSTRISIDLRLDEDVGRDARSMVRALEAIPFDNTNTALRP
jgi:hypothetical protein